MKFKNVPTLLFFLIIGFIYNPIRAQIPKSDHEKIEKAINKLKAAAPERDRHILVFSLSQGYKHASIPYADSMLVIMGRKTGSFKVTISHDMNTFAEENLRKFDAICFNNTTDLEFSNQQYRDNLLNFIKSGKGIIGLHAAIDNFKTWPAALEMMGGLFDGHPWVSSGTWKVKVSDPGHIINRGFDGKDFFLSDEIYRIRPYNLRQNSRVLLALDMTDETNLSAKGVKASDKDIPISWIRTYGKGRLFYCSLGHNLAVYWNENILAHYLAGIQFALGDLDVDTTPLPFNPQEQIKSKELHNYLDKLKDYKFGDSKEQQTDISAYLRLVLGSSRFKTNAEKQFIQFLESDATQPAKQFICEQLSIYGTDQSVPILAEMLTKNESFEMALYALERIRGKQALHALKKQLTSNDEQKTAAVIGALSKFNDESIADDLIPFVGSANIKIAEAAINALRKFCSEKVSELLVKELENAAQENRMIVADACLKCADKIFSEKPEKSQQIYAELSSAQYPYNIRLAAYRGIIKAADNPLEIIDQQLNSNNSEQQRVAVQLLNELPSAIDVLSLAEKINTLPEFLQVQMLTALQGRGEAKVTRLIEESLKSDDPRVRIAALKTLSKNGDAKSIPVLLGHAAIAVDNEKDAAREALILINAPGVDVAIIDLLKTSDINEKLELLWVIEQRQMSNASQKLLTEAESDNPEIRKAAYRTMAAVAPAEYLDNLLNHLSTLKSEDERNAIGKAIITLSFRTYPIGNAVKTILNWYKNINDVPAILSAFRIMSKTGQKEFMPYLRQALSNNDEEIRKGAVRALSDWPDTVVLADLLDLIKAGDKINHKLAFRGYIRIVQNADDFGDDEKTRHYKKALNSTSDTNEIQLTLSALSKNGDKDAFMLASEYLQDKQLNKAATYAVLKIAENIESPFNQESLDIIRKINQNAEDESIQKQSQDLLNKWQQKIQ